MTRKFETLYKVSSTGKITQWSISSHNDIYTIETGFTDGIKQSFPTRITDPKNSKSLEEQADSVAESAWNLKRKTMYPTIEEAWTAFNNKSMALGGYSPMLAELYDSPKKQKFNIANAYIQPKLDGARILARKVDDDVLLYARSGALKTTIPHINEQLNEVMSNGEIFDGEVYLHGMELEDILSLTQATKNLKDTSKLQYWVYDVPKIDDLKESDSYARRLNALMNRYGDSENKISKNIMITPTSQIESIKDIDEFHAKVVDDGYEGAILRNPNSAYQNKRTKDLLKVKKFQDAEFEIIAVNEGKGKLAGHAGTFECRMSDGRTFNAKLKGDTDNLISYFEHPEKVIGNYLTVQFFSYNRSGIPRFPVGIRIRKAV